ncbi:MAG TPA: hypothetical protein DEV98_05140 [Clostridiales bacterium]|nr:hypothetical protein [Clostridiales bacterium]
MENPAAHTLRRVCRLVAGFFNGLFCRSRTEGDPNSLEEEDNSDDFRQYPPFFNGVSISFLPRFKEN